MNNIELENRIISLVSSRNGMKGIDLSLAISSEFMSLTNNEILDTIFDLIESGDLVEVEYELASMPYRSKSFILPKDTVININHTKRISRER